MHTGGIGQLSTSVTPVETTSHQGISLTAPVGEQLETNYQVHELPSESDAMGSHYSVDWTTGWAIRTGSLTVRSYAHAQLQSRGQHVKNRDLSRSP